MKVLFYKTPSGRRPIKEFILEQDIETQIKVSEVITYFEKYHFHLPSSYLKRIKSTKSLWELRIKSRKSLRLLLVKITMNEVIILHGFVKKTQKTPQKEIEIAQERLKRILL